MYVQEETPIIPAIQRGQQMESTNNGWDPSTPTNVGIITSAQPVSSLPSTQVHFTPISDSPDSPEVSPRADTDCQVDCFNLGADMGEWVATENEPLEPSPHQLEEEADPVAFSKGLVAWVEDISLHPSLKETPIDLHTMVEPTDPIVKKFMALLHQAVKLEQKKSQELQQSPTERQTNLGLVSCLQELLAHLDIRRLNRLVLDIFLTQRTSGTFNLKENRPCFDLYRELCRIFTSHDLTDLIRYSPEQNTLDLVKSLFDEEKVWFDDAQVLTAFACQIPAAFPAPRDNELLWDILACPEMRNAITTSTNARVAYRVLQDERIVQLSAALSRGSLTWEPAEACVPGHPLVEEFLGSPQEQMFYRHPDTADFNTLALFSLRLIREKAKRGRILHISTTRQGLDVFCEIRKILPVDPPMTEEEKKHILSTKEMRRELEELLDLRQKLPRRQKDLTQQASESEQVVVSPVIGAVRCPSSSEWSPPSAKRIKTDYPPNGQFGFSVDNGL